MEAGYQFQLIDGGNQVIVSLVIRKPGRPASDAFEGFAGNSEGIVCHPGGIQVVVRPEFANRIDAEMRRLLEIRYSGTSQERVAASAAMRGLENKVFAEVNQ